MSSSSININTLYDSLVKYRSNLSQKFYNSFDEKKLNEQIEPLLKWINEFKHKLEIYNDIHYLCPKCFQFPLIDIISNEFILYCCKCNGDEKRFIKIKDLVNNYESSFSSNSEDKIKGLRCTGIHYSGKNGKFRYFCKECGKNICKECVAYHMESQKEKHELIVFDYKNIYYYKQLKQIYEEITEKDNNNTENNTEINTEINNSNDNSNDNSYSNLQSTLSTKITQNNKDTIEINKTIPLCDNLDKAIKHKYDDDFFKFINIIFNDFLNYPNYFHWLNIEEIYSFCLQKNFQAKIKYLNIPKQKNKIIWRKIC